MGFRFVLFLFVLFTLCVFFFGKQTKNSCFSAPTNKAQISPNSFMFYIYIKQHHCSQTLVISCQTTCHLTITAMHTEITTAPITITTTAAFTWTIRSQRESVSHFFPASFFFFSAFISKHERERKTFLFSFNFYVVLKLKSTWCLKCLSLFFPFFLFFLLFSCFFFFLSRKTWDWKMDEKCYWKFVVFEFWKFFIHFRPFAFLPHNFFISL